jgi:hypothetical protein
MNLDDVTTQYQTLLRLRHDVYVSFIEQVIKKQDFKGVDNQSILLEQNHLGIYQPDLVLNVSNEIYLIDVTFTVNKDVISEKREKYKQFGTVLVSSININEAEAYISQNLDELLSIKHRYITESSKIIDNFIQQSSLYFPELDLFDIKLLTTENCSVVSKMEWKTAISDIKKHSRESFPNQNILHIKDTFDFKVTTTDAFKKVADITGKLMEDEDINRLYSLEKVTTGVFTKCSKILSEQRRINYNTTNTYKPLFHFYASAMFTEASQSKKFVVEQDCLIDQFQILSSLNTPLKSFFKNILYSLSDPASKNVFKTGLPYDTEVQQEEFRLLYRKIKKFLRLAGSQDYMSFKKVLDTDEFFQSNQLKGIISKIISETTVPIVEFYKRLLSVDKKFTDWIYGLKFNDVLELHSPFIKTVTLNRDDPLDEPSKSFLSESKTHMTTDQYITDKLRKIERHENPEMKVITSVDENQYSNQIETLIANLSVKMPQFVPSEVQHMLLQPGCDNNFFKCEKDKFLVKFTDYITLLSHTPSLRFAFDIKRSIDQLLHFQNLNWKVGTYSFFNNNRPDYLYCVQHGLQDKGKDVGRAFFIIKFGPISQAEIDIFGFTHHSTDKSEVHYTDWRRLTSQRLAFHADQVYSVLSTSYSTFTRTLASVEISRKTMDQLVMETLKTFAFRLIIGFAHSQSTAEMLSDVRYLYMNAFSEFSCTQEFITDKYSKPIRTCLDNYIINSIPKFDIIRKAYCDGSIKIFNPTFNEGKRNMQTVGGIMSLASCIQPGLIMTDVQDLLDEMFVYVHTNKEPSSPYHEFVKAIKTIEKFQSKFDDHTKVEQCGDFNTFEEVKAFLVNDNQVGFWSIATFLAGRFQANNLSGLAIDKKISRKVASDTLLDMNSTKSVIPERQRLMETCEQVVRSNSSSDTKVMKKKKKVLWNQLQSASKLCGNLTTVKQKANDSLIVVAGTNRCKVHDSTIDIIDHIKVHKTLELAYWNASRNNLRMSTDICIKAQYGAKREFYVINHGAKAMARCLEQGYKVVCSFLENEMISVPGDRKMFAMQEQMDRILQAKTSAPLKIYYVNGDCTKWSAAETMECLYLFSQGEIELIGSDFSNLVQDVLFSWSNKHITMPPELYKNVFYKGPMNVNLLQDGTFISTQNFLQGMFNYMSSAKAVACSDLTMRLWTELYPSSPLKFTHMEHSDDYAFIVLAKDDTEFCSFKKLHRIVMRFCGINDSVKKTNVQHFLSEFISLISFNGVMTYPHIKKVKETGLNIGSLGYSSDIKVTCSRVGEAARVGIPFDVCYAMSRIQTCRIADAYGLFGKNKTVFCDQNPFNVPVELWGFPDCHPMLYLLTQGDPDNYRLRTHGNKDTITILDKLFLLKCSEDNINDDGVFSEDSLKGTRLYHPHYSYLTQGKLIEKIKQGLKYSLEDSKKYWNKHFLDLYIKPKDTKRYNDWLKSKYYQNTFIEAYMRQGRAQLQLRLSHFVRQACLNVTLIKPVASTDIPDIFFESKKMWTIKEYANAVNNWNLGVCIGEDQKHLQKLMEYSYDPTILKIYGYTKSTRITDEHFTTLYTRAYSEPKKSFEFSCYHDPARVLQYLTAIEDFKQDSFKPKSVTSFLQDVKHVTELLAIFNADVNSTEFEFSTMPYRNVVTELLYSMQEKTKPLLTTFNPENDILKTVKLYLEEHTSFNKKFQLQVNISEELMVHQLEVDFETQLYLKELEPNIEWIRESPALLNDITLLLFLLKDRAIHEVRQIMNKVKIINLNITAVDYLKNMIKLSEKNVCKLTPLQQECIVSLADVVLNDPLPMLQFMSNKLGFTYKYQTSNPLDGFTTVLIRCFKRNFKCIFRETQGKPGHNMTIYTNSANLTQLSWVYNVGLRLMGSISVNELLKRMNYQTIDYIPEEEPLRFIPNAMDIYKNTITSKIVIRKDPITDVIIPIQLIQENIEDFNGDFDNFHAVASFDLPLFSAYSNKAKVFTLNIFKLRQVNAWTFSGTDTIPINALLGKKNIECLVRGLDLTFDETSLSKVNVLPSAIKETTKLEDFKIKKQYRHTDKVKFFENQRRYVSQYKFLEDHFENPPMVESIADRLLASEQRYQQTLSQTPIGYEELVKNERLPIQVTLSQLIENNPEYQGFLNYKSDFSGLTNQINSVERKYNVNIAVSGVCSLDEVCTFEDLPETSTISDICSELIDIVQLDVLRTIREHTDTEFQEQTVEIEKKNESVFLTSLTEARQRFHEVSCDGKIYEDDILEDFPFVVECYRCPDCSAIIVTTNEHADENLESDAFEDQVRAFEEYEIKNDCTNPHTLKLSTSIEHDNIGLQSSADLDNTAHGTISEPCQETDSNECKLTGNSLKFMQVTCNGKIYEDDILEDFHFVSEAYRCDKCGGLVVRPNEFAEDNLQGEAMEDQICAFEEYLLHNSCEEKHLLLTETIAYKIEESKSQTLSEFLLTKYSQFPTISDFPIYSDKGLITNPILLVQLIQLMYQRIISPTALFRHQKSWLDAFTAFAQCVTVSQLVLQDHIHDAKNFFNFVTSKNRLESPFKLISKDKFENDCSIGALEQMGLFDIGSDVVNIPNVTLNITFTNSVTQDYEEESIEASDLPVVNPLNLKTPDICIVQATEVSHTNVPYLINKATQSVNSIDYKIGKALMQGSSQMDQLAGLYCFEISHLLSEYIHTLEKNDPIRRYLTAYLNESVKHIPGITKMRRFKGYGYKFERNEFKLFKSVKVNKSSLQSIVEKISWLDEAQINYINKSQFEVMVPQNEGKIREFRRELERNILGYFDQSTMIYKMVSLELNSSELIDEIEMIN